MVVRAIRFVCQRNLFSRFIAIECYLVSCVMVCFILNRCNSDWIVSSVRSIYSHCFTSCIFNSITGNIYFVFSICIASLFTVSYSDVSDVSVACSSRFFNYAFNSSFIACWQVAQVDLSCFVHCIIIAINIFQCNCFISVHCVCFVFDMNVISFGDTFNVANVSSVIDHIATRFKVSDVVVAHIHIAAIEFEFVAADCESSRTFVFNSLDVSQVTS